MAIKLFGEMSKEDYHALGFRCGLEVHQQLHTDKKLFCRCPNSSGSDSYDAELLRHMRPTLSELGEYDRTALMEYKTRKEIFYRINRNTVCTYEMDDTPPFPMNPEALRIALEIAMLLDSAIVGELHIARKQYLDGSIPTGFQRTAMVSLGGRLNIGTKHVAVRQMSIEEDSCRLYSDEGHNRVFLTDRLSIPLIEVVTEPELYDPWEAKVAGEAIRRLTRATGKVKTGTGCARQDVNVSVEGGTRVEIKGVHSLKLIPVLCHYEAVRQKALLDIRYLLKSKGLKAEDLGDTAADVSAVVERCTFQPIRTALSRGHRVMAVRLPGFQGILDRPIGPEMPFFWEFVGVVKVIACLDRMPNMIFDQRDDPRLAGRIWERIYRRLDASEKDAVVLVWGDERDTETAIKEILARARAAFDGVPPETRKALPDGRTVFNRVLPGPERMYPDTDLPPMILDDAELARIRAQLPAKPWEAMQDYLNLGLPAEHARRMFLSPRRRLFDQHAGDPSVDSRLLARLLLQEYPRKRRRRASTLRDTEIQDLLFACARGKICREAVPYLLAGRPSAVASQDLLYTPATRPEVEETVSRILDAADIHREDPGTEFRYSLGLVMPELRGRAPGALVAEVVRARLGELGATDENLEG